MKFACPCCGYLTLSEKPPGTFEICRVCYWEDDDVQFADPAYRGGANEVSLSEARDHYRAIKACDPRAVDRVREPLPEEIPPRN